MYVDYRLAQNQKSTYFTNDKRKQDEYDEQTVIWPADALMSAISISKFSQAKLVGNA